MMILGKIVPGRRSKKLRMRADQKGGHLAGMSEAWGKYSNRGPAVKIKSLDSKWYRSGGKATEES